MGREVTIEKNGVKFNAYLSAPTTAGPGVIVIHEWWGLNSPLSNIKEIADMFASAGFTALAPDLYHGKTADNPDDAGKLMMDMFQNRLSEVENIVKSSAEYLKELSEVSPKKVGITGFCCGGTLSMYLAGKLSDVLDASVPFYGLPQLAPVDPSSIKIPMFLIMAEKDEFVNNDEVIDLGKAVWKNGVELAMKVYAGVNHAFLNTKRPEVYNKDCAEDAFNMAVSFFKRHLS